MKSLDTDNILRLLSGDFTPEERREVERTLEESEALADEYERSRSVDEAVRTLSLVTPSADFTTNVMAAVGMAEERHALRRRITVRAGLTVVFVIVAGFLWFGAGGEERSANSGTTAINTLLGESVDLVRLGTSFLAQDTGIVLLSVILSGAILAFLDAAIRKRLRLFQR